LKEIREYLDVDPALIYRQIEQLLQGKLAALEKSGIIIGISGGFDSAVVAFASVKAVGREQVRFLNLPDRDSKPIHRQHARLVADELGVAMEVKDITPILDQMGVYQQLPS
jgi:NAD+ synthase